MVYNTICYNEHQEGFGEFHTDDQQYLEIKQYPDAILFRLGDFMKCFLTMPGLLPGNSR